MTMEELVQRLTGLQARRQADENAANSDIRICRFELEIRDMESTLAAVIQARDECKSPYLDRVAEIDAEIDDIKAQIIDAWNPETMKKTILFDAGTLKFRTTQSLKIGDEAWLLSELLRTMPCTGAVKYLKGFNSTAVKKFMGVHEIPAEAAELISKTTVKLED